MFKINPWFLGAFLAMMGLGTPILQADGSFSDVPSALSAASGTSQETTREEPVSDKVLSQDEAVEGGASEVDDAVVAAQQEIQDPFATSLGANVAKAPVQPVGNVDKLVLQGIGFGSKDAYAIFGGEVYFKGDEKNGIKLVEVRRREVDIIVNGGPMTCALFPDQDLKNAIEREKRKRAVSAFPADPSSESPSSMTRRESSPL
mgnify:CR=1 FL=1